MHLIPVCNVSHREIDRRRKCVRLTANPVSENCQRSSGNNCGRGTHVQMISSQMVHYDAQSVPGI